MSEMVDRVATAIHGICGNPDPSASDNATRELMLKAARTAIEAMREPTDEMLEAGAKAMVGSDEDALDCWPAMIDAVLKP